MIRERGIGLFDQLHAVLANYRARAKACRICLSPFHIEILRKERRDSIDAVDAHCNYTQFWRGSFRTVLAGGNHRLGVRSEARRVGTEWVITSSSRCLPYH